MLPLLLHHHQFFYPISENCSSVIDLSTESLRLLLLL